MYVSVSHVQLNKIAQAAAAASTYLYFHQDDEDAVNNVKYYSKLDNVGSEHLRSREPLPFSKLYWGGVSAHRQQRYADATVFMQDATTRLYDEFRVCRSNCEQHSVESVTERSRQSSFFETTVGLYRELLECRIHCWLDLGLSVSESSPLEVAPSAYHYMQFAFYQSKYLPLLAVGCIYALVSHPMLELWQHFTKVCLLHGVC